MIGLTLSVTRLGHNNDVVGTKDVHFSCHDGVESLNAAIKDEFELDTAARLKFCYEQMPYDPSDPPVYKPITATAVVGSILDFFIDNDPFKLWLPLEKGKAELAFTVVAVPAAAPLHTPGHAASGSSAAARSATEGATNSATQHSGVTALAGARRGKQRSQAWQEDLKRLARENIPRGSCGQYYLVEDNLKDTGHILAYDRAVCCLSVGCV